MQALEIITGFSDLKNLLIQTYLIDRERSLVKLYFSQGTNEILMHDNSDHKKAIPICLDIQKKSFYLKLTEKSKSLLNESLKNESPSKYLNEAFQLYGFFRF